MAGPATNSVSAAPRQLSDGNLDGTVLGKSSADLISFYGATPIVQPAGASEAALSANAASGQLVSYPLTISPVSCAANTTAEQTFTVTGVIGTGSVIVVNKPTSQAGLGVAGVRASAANQIGITFSNDTAAALTPTASEVYQVVEIQAGSGLTFSATLTPTVVAANSTVEETFTVPTGDIGTGAILIVNKPTAQAGLGVAGARVVGNNSVAITYFNDTASAITPTAAEVYLFADAAGLSASNNLLVYGVNVGTLLGCATITTAEQTVAVAGLLASDVIVGVSKPTAQAGLGIAGWRVSSAGNIGITFVNPTAATITPTASEVYKVTVYRADPLAPLVDYSQLLTPISVAANTTAEQTFTVAGLVASSAVIVNKPSAQPGLAIVGYRVSALNTLAINYQNDTAVAITPPAETYAIGNFQVINGGTSAATVYPYTAQPVGILSNAAALLANAMRNAMVSLGLIAGA